MEAFFSTLPPPDPKLDQGEIITIPLRDGTSSEIRVYRPSIASNSPKPLVVLIHGGGHVISLVSLLETNKFHRTVSSWATILSSALFPVP